MYKNHFLPLSALLLFATVLTLGSLLIGLSNAAAQSLTPEQRCYNKKLKAAGSHVRCLLNAQARANRNPSVDLQAAKDLCDQRFERRVNNAEAKAQAQGASCPSQGNMTPTDQNNTTASSTGNTVSDVKTLNIDITQDDFDFLMSESFNLNIAIKVNDSFSVVWRSVSDYTNSNQFQWSSVFHIFGSEEIEESEIVEIDTNVVSIALGQDVVFDTTELLDQPMSGNTENAITFINNSEGPIYPGIAQLLTFAGSTQAITPVFISQTQLQSGQSLVIRPTQEVLVWFGQEVKAGALFTEQVSFTEDVDLTDVSSATRLFSGRQWTIPPEN